jgi:23S rRNA (cytidine1920-2'-O)/16S rRNA (cytidine1409-2'-O)-methyltransferase
MNSTIRLDKLVAENTGFSREYSVEAIENGCVSFDGKVLFKAGMKVSRKLPIIINAEPMKYVSRGGYKLEHAVTSFEIDVAGKHCIDIGASAGGFTDCLLQHGAAHVTAVDCGTGQLSGKLRDDNRVAVYENTNIRDITHATFPALFDIAVIDVSFISLTLILPIAATLLKQDGQLVCLVKPQFEAGKQALNKKGVVTNERHRTAALDNVKTVAENCGFGSLVHAVSPVTGRDGNVEYLLYGRQKKQPVLS